MITLLKLGGSLITDKTKKSTFRRDVAQTIAREIVTYYQSTQDDNLIIGHGSGSFGHFAAEQYDTINGVKTANDWLGFTEVASAAAQLNYLMSEVLINEKLPIMRIQPSASAQCNDGNIVKMPLHTIEKLITHRIVPVVYGDVAIDSVRGGTIISTETIFKYLSRKLNVHRILLVGEVEGVIDHQNKVISKITPGSLKEFSKVLRGSDGTDVTGGMLTKVQDMVDLIKVNPKLHIQIIDGRDPQVLQFALTGQKQVGTLIIAN